MKQVNRKIRYIGIALLILAGLFVILPYLFMGPPTPFFSIYNGDKTSHTITLEIIDSNNKSVFENEYELSSQEKITESKSLWLLLKMSFPLSNNNYVVKTTMDNNISEETNKSCNPWTKMYISIVDSSVFIDTMQV
jgi:hypothetical protein